MKTKKERIFYYDLLRAFAIIAVIICHVDHFFGPLTTQAQVIAQLTFHDIGDIGVPIFLMISGALLLNREYPSLGAFLKKRFARIIYPFIFWIILILGQLYLHGYNSKFIWNVFIGEPSITWYFWTLIGIYLFIPIINSFVKDYKLKGVEYFLAIWSFIMILNTFHSYPLWMYFNLDMFAGFVGYPLLGYYLANKKFKLSDKSMCILGLLILLVSLAVFVYFNYSKIDLLSPRYLNITNIFMGIGMFLFIMYLDKLNVFNTIKDNFIGKAIISLSVCSYGMYFSHVIVVKALSYHNPGSNLLFPLMFVLIVFLSWLIPYIMSKIPYLKIVSGV
ncbi:acyltransferase [Methanobrevibacter millerae]|uniref:Surface polysaccharide O-acyltransferase, integral membrane enzyme n=1 Tax=Methanobrevibacter millerae TaxID=230361 RepID=A0A1G5WWQ7_9EURY|nr:acyltransferase [Methanobrevibacter millerae]SDA62442.1 Surface polysaccharide O-acyltransferase, integral membrane enzyme [Methanobrevibacter millerae]